MEVILEYINSIEDPQKKSKREGNPITAATLFLISTIATISTDSFPHSDKIWEDLSKEKEDWYAWKTLYKSSDQKAKVKKKAVGGQDQFGEAHGAFNQSPTPYQKVNVPSMMT